MPFLSALLCGAAILMLQSATAAAQSHQHPPQDLAIHEKFYSNWMMPDQPNKSCCSMRDCYPTEVAFKDGQWFARRREDGKMIPVPWSKVERNRDNPDGRNHVCMPPPRAAYPQDTVFCFSLGHGT